MKPVALIQARTGSSRLPGKVLAAIGDRPMLERVVDRCRASAELGGVGIVTSDSASDDAVTALAISLDIPVFRGSELDVLDRYVGAVKAWDIETVVRVTADCPLVDPEIIDEIIRRHRHSDADYVCIDGYPNGVTAELATRAALHRAHEQTRPEDTFYREHVITYIVERPDLFRLDISLAPEPLRRPELRLSVDEVADLELVRWVYASAASASKLDAEGIIRLLDSHPEMARLNAHVQQKTR